MLPTLPDTNVTLTPEQIEQIKQARVMIPKVIAQIRKAQAAGIDMSQQLADVNTLQAQLDKLYRTYVIGAGASPGT